MRQIFVVGNVNLDIIMGSQTPWPAVGTEAVLPNMQWRPGGAAGNAALALQALQAQFQLVAALGHDPFGLWLQEAFSQIPGSLSLLESNTALSVGITHPDNERTFFSYLGHLEAFKLEHVLEGLVTAKAGDIVLLLGAFLMPQLRRRYLELLQVLKSRALVVALDPGWASEGWDACREEANAWLPHCDHLLINEVETLHWGNKQNLDESFAALRQALPAQATLVVKRGALGATWHDGNAVRQSGAPEVKVIDTIGAGDTFDAAYLNSLVQGQPLERCVQAGVATASLAVSTFPRVYTQASLTQQRVVLEEYADLGVKTATKTA